MPFSSVNFAARPIETLQNKTTNPNLHGYKALKLIFGETDPLKPPVDETLAATMPVLRCSNAFNDF